MIFVFNFTPVPRDGYYIGVPRSGGYRKIFDSDDSRFGGGGYNEQDQVSSEAIECHDRPYRIALNLPPLGALVLQLTD